MALQAVTGATVLCTMGLAPGQLIAAQTIVLAGGLPAATIQDVVPLTNLTPCGLCTSLANPAVASATAAALGVLTPMPCIPAPLGPWSCGKSVMIGGVPALSMEGQLTCSYGGSLKILSPGQTVVHI